MGHSYFAFHETQQPQSFLNEPRRNSSKVRSRSGAKSQEDRKPTWTFLTQEALRTYDDMLTPEDLMVLTGANINQMSATLHHLHERKVVDTVEQDGRVWYFLTGDDTRSKIVEERTPEEPGTRCRRSKRSRAQQDIAALIMAH